MLSAARGRGKSAFAARGAAGHDAAMALTLCLLRHGRATGQGPDAALMPEGAEYVRTLGRRLAAEGFRPARTYASPYLRARDTATIVLSEVAPGTRAEHLVELTPEHDPERTLETLRALELPAARVLLVAHLPLVALLVQALTEDVVAFSPGTLVEVETDAELRAGRVARVVGPPRH